ncbi:MAG: hypothetical protein DRP78_06060 [Candidatus Omnitrophota bacterium]|nr:MAG: hypothetical protein DRP78_06060 [Candidatus Omnitrophota bacterium]
MKNKVRILLGFIIFIFILFWYLAGYTGFLLRNVFIVFSGIGLISSLYLINRINIFNKRLSQSLRYILENNFQTGIALSGSDEFSLLSEQCNLVIERINEYDSLRENKIVILNRLLNIFKRNVPSGIIIIDLEFAVMKLNRATQAIFGITQDELTIDSVINLESNTAFNDLYQDVITGKANTIARKVELFLPVLKAKAVVNLKMFAIKDKDEKLNTILCLLMNQ